jgi:parallel beta-helix repeat protein
MYDGITNANALQAAIDAAQNSSNPNGAIVLIPSFDGQSPPNYGPYAIAVPDSLSAAVTIPESSAYSTSPLLICGTGIGTTLQMSVAGGTLFQINSSSYVAFQDLTIEYVISGEFGGQGTAFDFSTAGTGTSEGYKLFRVNILNCQAGVFFENGVTISSMLQCNVTYDVRYPVMSLLSPVGVNTSGAQTIIDQCTFTCINNNPYATGILIGGTSDPRVTNSTISGFATGILVSGITHQDAHNASFSSLEIDATGTCISIGSDTYDVDFTNCNCQPTAGSSPTVPGILLQTDTNGNLDTVRFTACSVSGYSTYGLEIMGGQNIQINGGNYSGNGTAGIAITAAATEIQIEGASCVGPSYAGSTSPTLQSYGIYITAGSDIQLVGVNCSGNGTSSESPNGIGVYVNGSVADVRIVGAICNGPVLGESSAITQEYGIYVGDATGVVIEGCSLTSNTQYGVFLTGVTDVTVSSCDLYYSSITPSVGGIYLIGGTSGSTNVFVRGCNISGYGSYTSAFDAITSSTLTNVQVTNCAGYNDQQVRLAHTSPGSGSFNGVTYQYFGPVAFYVTGSSLVILVDTHNTHLSGGSFSLNPGESAQISSGTISTFLMIGK